MRLGKQWEALPKEQSELLTSCLQQWNLYDRCILKSLFRKHFGDLQQFFTFENNSICCKDIRCLFNALEITYESRKWKLFTYGSLYSIKVVLLYIGNTVPLVLVSHSFI